MYWVNLSFVYLLLYFNLILHIPFTFCITVRDFSLTYGLDIFAECKNLLGKISESCNPFLCFSLIF